MARIDEFDEEYENFEEEDTTKNDNTTMKKIIPIIIIIVVSLTLGITTYVIFDILINNQKPKENEEFIGEQISLNDENVQVLYQYVTYGLNGKRNEKFTTERTVTMDSFSDQEKLFFALQFVDVEDFEFTGEYDTAKQKIYTIPNSTIMNYMKLYFGPNVRYQNVPTATYTFTFQINKMNVGTMKYNSARDGYDTVFASFEEIEKPTGPEPVYGKLISAMRRADGSIVLQERVVYTELRTDNGGYALNIYKDPEKQVLLDTKSGLTDSDLQTITVDVSAYEQTAVIEYVFGVSNMQCYFESSRIIL